MKTTLLWTLTLLNLALLAHRVMDLRAAEAKEEDLGLLRGRGLEIVDAQGRVRMQVKVEPANETFRMPDGSVGYPETVILRLMTADGKPRVKLTTSPTGSGLMLLGDSDDTRTLLHADGKRSSLEMQNDAETRKVLAP